ncbi:MAG: endonuclease [Clostridia bacterium]
MRAGRFLLKLLGAVAAAAVLAVAGLLAYLTMTEYKPADVEPLVIAQGARQQELRTGMMLKMITWNTGYAALDRTADFFMDGGTMVRAQSEAQVRENLSEMLSMLAAQKADVYLLQEVDQASYRSYYVNQAAYYQHGLSLSTAFAYHYLCDFVPYPWPPIGKVASGLLTCSALSTTKAEREALPVPFSWPMRVANLKRCLLIERIPVSDTGKELVLINLHLEAYDDGEGKAAQTEQLMRTMLTEYRKGNYVIAGGDFNQTFEGAPSYPEVDISGWRPGLLRNSDLPTGFRYVFDADSPTCRLLNAPYGGTRKGTQLYVIDGFIVSDNIKVNNVETIDLNFRSSDHNPVALQITLQ